MQYITEFDLKVIEKNTFKVPRVFCKYFLQKVAS